LLQPLAYVSGPILLTALLGGFERFFAALGPMLRAGPPDLDAIGELAGQYGLQYDFASLPTLLDAAFVHLGPERQTCGRRWRASNECS
jgi:hypothetical protein